MYCQMNEYILLSRIYVSLILIELFGAERYLEHVGMNDKYY